MKPRSSHRRCSVKKLFLEISQNSQENTCAQVAQVFSCEFCEISKNKFFPELLRWLLLETNSCVLFCHSLLISKHMEVLQRRSNSSTVLKTNIHDLTIASLLYTLRAHKKIKMIFILSIHSYETYHSNVSCNVLSIFDFYDLSVQKLTE